MDYCHFFFLTILSFVPSIVDSHGLSISCRLLPLLVCASVSKDTLNYMAHINLKASGVQHFTGKMSNHDTLTQSPKCVGHGVSWVLSLMCSSEIPSQLSETQYWVWYLGGTQSNSGQEYSKQTGTCPSSQISLKFLDGTYKSSTSGP